MNIDWRKLETAQTRAKQAAQAQAREAALQAALDDTQPAEARLNALLQLLGYRPLEV